MKTNIKAKRNQIQTWNKNNKIAVPDLDIEEQNSNRRQQNPRKKRSSVTGKEKCKRIEGKPKKLAIKTNRKAKPQRRPDKQ